MDGASPRPSAPRRQRNQWTAKPFWTGLLLLGLLSSTACGSGGGSSEAEPEPPPPPPPGIQGKVVLTDCDLGCVTEQEPNNQQVQAYRIPPVPQRTLLEVTGEIGVTGERYGRPDPVDVLRLDSLADQDLALTLAFAAEDPLGGGANDLELQVFDRNTSALLASAVDGPPSRETAFQALAGRTYFLVLTCRNGHTGYVLTIDGTGGTPVQPISKASYDDVEATEAEATDDGTTPAMAPPDCAGTHVLVRLREGADPAAVAARLGLDRARATALGTLRLKLRERIVDDRVRRVLALCARLTGDADVVAADPDWVVRPLMDPDDSEYGRQWNLRAIGIPEAWEITRGSNDIVVGVVDSGIVAHPDLQGRIANGHDFIEALEIAGDGDGRDIDPTDVGAEEDPSGLSTWHGTHVAGIIVANADDGYGIAGVAPGCRVMPLRAVGRTGGYVSDVIDAILFAAKLFTTEDGRQLSSPLPIVNLSFGVDIDVPDLRLACTQAANRGVLLVGAVGNTGQRVQYPARYSSVLAVGAVDRRLDTTGYSNFGDEVDISAPGGLMEADACAAGWPDGILSCVLDGTVHPMEPSHAYLQGTSQAAPHVAGAAALLLSVDPTLDRQHLWDLLLGGSLDRGAPGPDVAYGWGVLRVHHSLKLLLSEMGTPWTAAPHLTLAQKSVQFDGFTTRHEIAVLNTGGGFLELSDPLVETDDGVEWLAAENDPAPGGSPSNVEEVIITVYRSAVPKTIGRYTGTVFIRDSSGSVIDSIRVTLLVSQYLQAGRTFQAIVHRANGSLAGTGTTVSPQNGYRFWFPKLDSGDYKIRGGTDLDSDGFACETGDACGWHGGPTEAEAAVLVLERDQTLMDADVFLRQP